MASGTIPKTIIKSDNSGTFVGVNIGASGTKNCGSFFYNDDLQLIDFALDFGTGGALSVGTSYTLGSTVFKPRHRLMVPLIRMDGGNAIADVRFDTNGTIYVCPLTSIPSGVTVGASVTYFYNRD